MAMSTITPLSPLGLSIRLAVYYFALLASVIAVINYWPDAMQYLPFGGRHALEGSDVQSAADFLKNVSSESSKPLVDMESARPVQTVILFSGVFAGTALGMPTGSIVVLFLAIQIVAIPGTLLFGHLADRFGHKRSILVCLVVWSVGVTAHSTSSVRAAKSGIAANRSTARPWS